MAHMTATFGRGLARTRFSNFALICLAMSSLPKPGNCKDPVALGIHANCAWLLDIERRGRGACRTGAGEAVAGALSAFDLGSTIQQLPQRAFESGYIPTMLSRLREFGNKNAGYATTPDFGICRRQRRLSCCCCIVSWRLSKYTAVCQKVRSSRGVNQTGHGSKRVSECQKTPFESHRRHG